jgi:AraC-like ligand binding domain.
MRVKTNIPGNECIKKGEISILKNKVSFFQKGLIEIVNGEGTHNFPYHTHKSFLVGVIKSGEARFIIGRREYLLTKGMTYIVPPDIGMSISPIKPYSYLTICIKISGMEQIDLYNTEMNMKQGLGEKVITLSEQFVLTKMTEEEFISKLSSILGIQIDKKKLNIRTTGDVIRLSEKYMNDHLNEKFVLEDLAKTVYISKYHDTGV